MHTLKKLSQYLTNTYTVTIYKNLCKNHIEAITHFNLLQRKTKQIFFKLSVNIILPYNPGVLLPKI